MDYRGWTARSPAGLRPLGLLIFSLATLSLALWSLGLGQRPLHNDEAVNGIKFGRLWQGGGYQYDPNEHHGPSLYYATYAINRLTEHRPDSTHSAKHGCGSSRWCLGSA